MDSVAGICQDNVPEGMATSSSKQSSLLSAIDAQMDHNIDVVCLRGGHPFLPACTPTQHPLTQPLLAPNSTKTDLLIMPYFKIHTLTRTHNMEMPDPAHSRYMEQQPSSAILLLW